ncbi:MAG: hypothetical protein M0P71_01755 [Melioribacteraceae bacterium]|nr:hypothetical protein [Melioribacteraceae bacterium]
MIKIVFISSSSKNKRDFKMSKVQKAAMSEVVENNNVLTFGEVKENYLTLERNGKYCGNIKRTSKGGFVIKSNTGVFYDSDLENIKLAIVEADEKLPALQVAASSGRGTASKLAVNPVDTLKMKFVNGEITAEDFQAKMEILKSVG